MAVSAMPDMGGTPVLLKMKRRRSDLPIHVALIAIVAFTLLPFVFVVNNSMRRTSEQFHSFFGLPTAVKDLVRFTWYAASGQADRIEVPPTPDAPPATALSIKRQPP